MQVQAGPAWREHGSQVLTSRDEGCEPGFVDDGRRGQEAVIAVEKLQAAHVTAIWAGLGGCGTISSFQAGPWEALCSVGSSVLRGKAPVEADHEVFLRLLEFSQWEAEGL